jgi:4-hydroxy-tetrahydrodipicolinate synthase
VESTNFRQLVRGPVTVVFTPFDDQGEHIDEDALRENVRYIIANGIQTGAGLLVAGGSTGDCYLLTTDERKRVFEIVVEEAQGKVPVICGANHTSTRAAVELSLYAEKVGADGVLLTPPYYWSVISDDAVYEHYKAVSEAINIAIMIYNNPNIVNKDLSLDLLHRLTELKNVQALKECTNSHIKYSRVIHQLGDRLAIVNGAGEWFEPTSYQMGVKAFISGFANFAPALCREIHDASMAGDYVRAKAAADRFRPLLEIRSRYVAQFGPTQGGEAYKEMARILGFRLGKSRLPVLPVTEWYHREIKGALEAGGFRK